LAFPPSTHHQEFEMSNEAAAEFMEKCAGSDALQAQIANATTGKDARPAADAIVAIGKANGFEFTADEALALAQRRPPHGGELSAQELEQVSGGAAPIMNVFRVSWWVGRGSTDNRMW
jgi:predicted ribosomally synthesized peptide with nif11-like leader